MRTLLQAQDEFNVLFVRKELDDYGLTANQFRLYAHLARRAGSDGAWPSVESMARHCLISHNTVRGCLRRLKELNLIHAKERPGFTTLYTLTSRSKWKPIPSRADPYQKRGAPSDGEGTPTKVREGGPTKRREGKVSQEGNPLKDNTVEEHSEPKAPFLPPPGSNGSVTASHHAAVNGKDSRSTSSRNGHGRRTQPPITRKAYAIVSLLWFYHYDNCKVRFVKRTAKAYAEGALRDGHDQLAILKAYDVSLAYCHRLTTDEISDHKRDQLDTAPPALTVWLARQRLSGDPRTVEERWKNVIARLTVEKRRAIEEEARIEEEVAKKAPKIKAWFSSKRQGETSRTNPTISTETVAEASPFERQMSPSLSASPKHGRESALSCVHGLPSERFPLGGAATSLPLSVGHTTTAPQGCASSASITNGQAVADGNPIMPPAPTLNPTGKNHE